MIIFQMNKNKNAETLIWIVIWLVIFLIMALWIINIISYNKILINDYENINFKNIIKSNSDIIIKKSNLSSLNENEEFYINKNKTNKSFEVLTWAINIWSKYVDLNWDKVTDLKNNINTYSRIFENKWKIWPSKIKISNIVVHIDKYIIK